jgi:hypothetical protein
MAEALMNLGILLIGIGMGVLIVGAIIYFFLENDK